MSSGCHLLFAQIQPPSNIIKARTILRHIVIKIMGTAADVTFLFFLLLFIRVDIPSRASHRGSKYKTGDRYAHSDDALVREGLVYMRFLTYVSNKIKFIIAHRTACIRKKKNPPQDSLLVILKRLANSEEQCLGHYCSYRTENRTKLQKRGFFCYSPSLCLEVPP